MYAFPQPEHSMYMHTELSSTLMMQPANKQIMRNAECVSIANIKSHNKMKRTKQNSAHAFSFTGKFQYTPTMYFIKDLHFLYADSADTSDSDTSAAPWEPEDSDRVPWSFDS